MIYNRLKKFMVLTSITFLFCHAIVDSETKFVVDAIEKLSNEEVAQYSKMQSLGIVLRRLGLQAKHGKLFRKLLNQRLDDISDDEGYKIPSGRAHSKTSSRTKTETEEEQVLKLKYERTKQALEEIISRSKESSMDFALYQAEPEKTKKELDELKKKMAEMGLGQESSSMPIGENKVQHPTGPSAEQKDNSDEDLLKTLSNFGMKLIKSDLYFKGKILEQFINYIKNEISNSKKFYKKNMLDTWSSEALFQLKKMDFFGLNRSNLGELFDKFSNNKATDLREKLLSIFGNLVFNFEELKLKVEKNDEYCRWINFVIKYLIDAESETSASVEDEVESDATFLKVIQDNVKSEQLTSEDLKNLIIGLENLLVHPKFFMTRNLIGQPDKALLTPKIITRLFQVDALMQKGDTIDFLDERTCNRMIESNLFLKKEGIKSLDEGKIVEGAISAVNNLSRFLTGKYKSGESKTRSSDTINLNTHFKNVKSLSDLKIKMTNLQSNLSKIEDENVKAIIQSLDCNNLTADNIKALNLQPNIQKKILQYFDEASQTLLIMKRLDEFMLQSSNTNLKALVKKLFIGSPVNTAKTKIEMILSIKQTPADVVSILKSFFKLPIKENDKYSKYIYRLIYPYFMQYRVLDDFIDKMKDVDEKSVNQKTFASIFLKDLFDALNLGKFDEKFLGRFAVFFPDMASSKNFVVEYNKFYVSYYKNQLNDLCRFIDDGDVSNFIIRFNQMVANTMGEDLVDIHNKSVKLEESSSSPSPNVTPPSPSSESGPDVPPPPPLPPAIPAGPGIPLPPPQPGFTKIKQLIDENYEIAIPINNVKGYLKFLKKLEHLLRVHSWLSLQSDIDNIQKTFMGKMSILKDYLQSIGKNIDNLSSEESIKEKIKFNSLKNLSLDFYSTCVAKNIEKVVSIGKKEIKFKNWTVDSKSISFDEFENAVKEALQNIKNEVQLQEQKFKQENIDKYTQIIKDILQNMSNKIKVLKNEESQEKLKFITVED